MKKESFQTASAFEDSRFGGGYRRLEGKTALITGGSSGIGKACAQLFAREGAHVVIVSRNAQKAGNTVDEIQKAGGSAAYICCDVSKHDSVEEMKRIFQKKYSRLDILVNNAGVLCTGALEEITEEDWNLTYDTNVKSIFMVCQAMIGFLQESHGVILNNASINGLHSYIKGKRSYMYASSKAAAIQLTRYLAKNYTPDVRVNCLCPGITETNLFTNRDFSRFDGCNLLGRIAKPEEIANIAAFLVSEEASFMTGSIVAADGGEMLA